MVIIIIICTLLSVERQIFNWYTYSLCDTWQRHYSIADATHLSCQQQKMKWIGLEGVEEKWFGCDAVRFNCRGIGLDHNGKFWIILHCCSRFSTTWLWLRHIKWDRITSCPLQFRLYSLWNCDFFSQSITRSMRIDACRIMIAKAIYFCFRYDNYRCVCVCMCLCVWWRRNSRNNYRSVESVERLV